MTVLIFQMQARFTDPVLPDLCQAEPLCPPLFDPEWNFAFAY